jgi:hypothetical protein
MIMKKLAMGILMVAAACGAPKIDNAPPQTSIAGAAYQVARTVSRGGDLFIMPDCEFRQSEYICSPFKMSIAPGAPPRTKTVALAPVRIPASRANIQDLLGSTVDIAHRRVFWHAVCDPSYHVTDIDSGETRTFRLDPSAIGIGSDNGVCLGEMVYDGSRVIALGGRVDHHLGKSVVEYALALDGNGHATLLHDFAPQVDPKWTFLHEMQTIAVYDPDTQEITSPLLSTDGEDRLVYEVSTGDVKMIGPGGGRQQSFFELTTRQNTYFDCDIPGWTNFPDGGPARITIGQSEIVSIGIDDICHHGFVGGGYDPKGNQDFVLFRTGPITNPNAFFQIGVADLKANRWLGFHPTDATYRMLHASNVGPEIFFTATEFIPSP